MATNWRDKMNNYLEGKKIVLDSDFKIKNLETFRGHDGTGINADIYHGKNRIAFVHDSAYGGGLEITYLNYDNKKNEYNNYIACNGDNKSENFMKDFLKNLPKYNWKEWCEHHNFEFDKDDDKNSKEWKDEDLFNEVIEITLKKKELKKLLKKVIFLDSENNLSGYSIPHCDREKLFKIEGKVRSARTFCVDKGYILLNDLAEEEALELYLNSNNGPK
tara:strand:- start:243 stop:896 length:654 start_codon:yes stop_codon:yes gene_type:complete